MAKVRAVLGHVEVQTAKLQRVCHRNRDDHSIRAGESFLLVHNPGGTGYKNYCRQCASQILQRAEGDLVALKSALTPGRSPTA